MPELTTKQICELLVYNNISDIKSKNVWYFSFIVSFISVFFIYKFQLFIIINNMMIDYIIGIVSMSIIFYIVYNLSLYVYILKIEKFILLNIDILLENVNIEELHELYRKAKNENIGDENLLKYLQKNSS